jgi:hypothetical protein
LLACDAGLASFWRAVRKRGRFGLTVEGGATLYPVEMGDYWAPPLEEWLRAVR